MRRSRRRTRGSPPPTRRPARRRRRPARRRYDSEGCRRRPDGRWRSIRRWRGPPHPAQANEQEWRGSEAESHYRRAIAVDPNDAAAHLGLGHSCSIGGAPTRGWPGAPAASSPALARRPCGWRGSSTTPAATTRPSGSCGRCSPPTRTMCSVVVPGLRPHRGVRGRRRHADGRRAAAVWDRNPAALALLARAYARAGRRTDAARIVGELDRARPRGLRRACGVRPRLPGTGDTIGHSTPSSAPTRNTPISSGSSRRTRFRSNSQPSHGSSRCRSGSACRERRARRSAD